MTSLVSVIVPTFNRSYCLGRTLDSVLAQTYPNYEIIVVDDGSTDNTRDLIARCYGDEPRVRYVFQGNAGVSAARNRGISLAIGNYVAFLDSDDIWKPWKLAVQLACFQHFPEAGMAWTDMEAIDPQGIVVNPRYLRAMYSAYRWFNNNDLFERSVPIANIAPELNEFAVGRSAYFGDIYSAMIMGNLVHTSTVLVRRERLEKVKGFNEDLKYSGEDYDFHLRTCRNGPVAFIDVSSIEYQRGMPDRLTRPEYSIHMARNFLKTVLPAIESDRARIKLPEKMIRDVLAGAYSWLAEEQIDLGDSAQAHGNILASLRYKFFQPRIWFLLITCFISPNLRKKLRNMYRSFKNILRFDLS